MLNHNIIIIGDETQNPNSILEIIKSEYPQCRSALTNYEVSEILDTKKPTVLVFYLTNIDSAENFYLKLYRTTTDLSKTPYKTILLCDHSESLKAHNLCREYVFDDYLSVNPLNDEHRLKFCIFQAIKQISLETKIQSTTDLSLTWLNDINSSEVQIHNLIKSADKLVNLVSDQHDELSEDISKVVTDMTNQLENEPYNEYITLKQADNFKNKFNKDTEKAVAKAIENSKGILTQQIKATKQVYYNEYQRLQAEAKKAKETLNNSSDRVLFSEETTKKESLTTKKNKPLLIMIIDSDVNFLNTIKTTLINKGLRVIIKNNTKSAFSSMLHDKPDLLLFDYDMPGMKGDAIFRMSKILLDTEMPPVIMTTHHATEKQVNTMIDCGAKDVISKPIDINSLMSKIREITA